MKFCTSAVVGFLAVASSSVNAFTPTAGFAVENKSGLMIPKQLLDQKGDWSKNVNNINNMAPSMVAGGAERSVGQEYYEGKQIFFELFLCRLESSLNRMMWGVFYGVLEME